METKYGAKWWRRPKKAKHFDIRPTQKNSTLLEYYDEEVIEWKSAENAKTAKVTKSADVDDEVADNCNVFMDQWLDQQLLGITDGAKASLDRICSNKKNITTIIRHTKQ